MCTPLSCCPPSFPHTLNTNFGQAQPHWGWWPGAVSAARRCLMALLHWQVESRRITHISAEQKRRFNIKLGFNTLHSLVSTLNAQPSIKVSAQRCMDRPALSMEGQGVSPGDAASPACPSAGSSCPVPQPLGQEAASLQQAHGDPYGAAVPGWSGHWSRAPLALPALLHWVPHTLPVAAAPCVVSPCCPSGQQGHHLAEDS